MVEGWEVKVLADSGSQVNAQLRAPTRIPCSVTWGSGGLPTKPDRFGRYKNEAYVFVILRVQVSKIAGYDEDVVFLVVANESNFSRCMLLVVGTCTLGRIINVIK